MLPSFFIVGVDMCCSVLRPLLPGRWLSPGKISRTVYNNYCFQHYSTINAVLTVHICMALKYPGIQGSGLEKLIHAHCTMHFCHG